MKVDIKHTKRLKLVNRESYLGKKTAIVLQKLNQN